MSKKLTFLYLSEPDVIKTGLTLTETIELCTESLKQHGLKEVENPPKPGVHPKEDSFINAMPGWLKQKGVCGIKWVSGFPENVKQRLPSIVGVIILNSTETGFPTAVMDGTYITAIRTAAVSGVSAKYLARKDSEVLAVIGTGVQGKYNTLCLTTVLPSIKKVKIFDTWAPSLQTFQDQIRPLLPNVEFETASSMEEAIRDSDVIVGATAKLTETVYSDEWVKPGALVLPIQVGGWDPDVLSKFDKVVADDWAQLKAQQDFSRYTSNFDTPYAELGEIVMGKKPGRENDQEKIINFNKGLAVHDMICGGRVLEKAKKQGLGVELELMDLGSPIPMPPV
uniref:Ketimine reductase mu-crystallin n=1 Tax=Suberites domuncula TaxID=55567 RepID=B1GT63_SUBDO|nr:tauropine dehydrogenase [Suberites domuncula]CAN84630.1 tauropine dehydrogenase [Suberites domuncula]